MDLGKPDSGQSAGGETQTAPLQILSNTPFEQSSVEDKFSENPFEQSSVKGFHLTLFDLFDFINFIVFYLFLLDSIRFCVIYILFYVIFVDFL